MKRQNLFQSYAFNNGVEIKNRLVVAPMTHLASDENGHITADCTGQAAQDTFI